ncbi:hypothetical protein [Mangrovicoccus sp. HB161399]|uniref:hypothetical protein n=1 Tax=Mangrovicoccus sp. HB161399 TaxID=2720392 RepID=UPI0015551E3E|nr:hypothetical protein [Mangrovicoccus sp. HB161399]
MMVLTDGNPAALPPEVAAFMKTLPRPLAGPVPVPYPAVSADAGEDFGDLQSLEASAPPPRDALLLDRWDVRTHQYTAKMSARMSLLSGLFSGGGSDATVGVVQEAKRFVICEMPDRRPVEVGVAVRLMAAARTSEADIKLTLADIAANAQLGRFDARITISVSGFAGPLGALLPAPRELDVRSLSVYTDAFRDIQAHVFSAESQPFLAPVLLGFDDEAPSVPSGSGS